MIEKRTCEFRGQEVVLTGPPELLDEIQNAPAKLKKLLNWRFAATIDRLIGNIPSVCEILIEEGHTSLAGQLQRDRDNLVHWREHNKKIALCPHCNTDVLSTLLPITRWHDDHSYRPELAQAIFFNCPHCGEEIRFELKWEIKLRQIIPLERPEP